MPNGKEPRKTKKKETQVRNANHKYSAFDPSIDDHQYNLAKIEGKKIGNEQNENEWINWVSESKSETDVAEENECEEHGAEFFLQSAEQRQHTYTTFKGLSLYS